MMTHQHFYSNHPAMDGRGRDCIDDGFWAAMTRSVVRDGSHRARPSDAPGDVGWGRLRSEPSTLSEARPVNRKE